MPLACACLGCAASVVCCSDFDCTRARPGCLYNNARLAPCKTPASNLQPSIHKPRLLVSYKLIARGSRPRKARREQAEEVVTDPAQRVPEASGLPARLRQGRRQGAPEEAKKPPRGDLARLAVHSRPPDHERIGNGRPRRRRLRPGAGVAVGHGPLEDRYRLSSEGVGRDALGHEIGHARGARARGCCRWSREAEAGTATSCSRRAVRHLCGCAVLRLETYQDRVGRRFL